MKAKEGRNSSKEEGNEKQRKKEGGGRTEEGGADIPAVLLWLLVAPEML